jgi:uncharacterized cupredoxin-like copper-binding protein
VSVHDASDRQPRRRALKPFSRFGNFGRFGNLGRFGNFGRIRPFGRIAAVVALATATTVGILSATLALGSAFAAPAGASTSKVTVVKATETDFHIALSKSKWTPGKYTFVAINKGATTHNIEITGPGLNSPVSKNISPRQSTKLTVTLKKGKYDLFCAIPGHKALGMNVNLTVS